MVHRRCLKPVVGLEVLYAARALRDCAEGNAAERADRALEACSHELSDDADRVSRRHGRDFDGLRVRRHDAGGKRAEIGGPALEIFFRSGHPGFGVELGQLTAAVGAPLIVGADDDDRLELELIDGLLDKDRTEGDRREKRVERQGEFGADDPEHVGAGEAGLLLALGDRTKTGRFRRTYRAEHDGDAFAGHVVRSRRAASHCA